MDRATIWQNFLKEWPPDLPPRGVVVTSFSEQIVFKNFFTSSGVVLFERQAPDSVGGRRVILAYSDISAIKIVDPVTNELFTKAGFTAPVGKGKSASAQRVRRT